MSYFFNGRLWVTPAVMSLVDDSAMFNPNQNVGNILALVGRSAGGQPNTALTFNSAPDAVATLISGDLVDAVTRAFDPSSEVPGPSQVVVVRVNPALQSTLALKDGAAASVIDLATTDYGQWTQQIKVKVEAGSTAGLKLTTGYGANVYTQDNVYRNAFSIQYAGGQASATMTVNNTQVVLSAPTGTVVSTIDLTVFSTIQQLVDKINTVAGFSATVLDGNGAKAALNGLDNVTAQDVKTALYTATATLQAAVDWFNSAGEGYITATRHAGAGTLPAVLPYTYLAGGSDGTVTNSEWSNAFTTLQTAECQWVVPCSTDPAIHAMADAHVAFCSNILRKERRAICGTPLATTDATAITLAKAINSDRTSLTHLGVYDYDVNGVYTLYAPFIAAAMMGGAFSGVSPGTALTNKSLKIRGIERNLRNPTDTDALILGGVLCIANTRTGFRVVKSVSTWLTNLNYNRVEQSVGAALDLTARTVRDALADLKGAPGSPLTLSQAVSRTDSALRGLANPAPAGPGVLVGDAANPPYKDITVKLSGDVLAVEFQCSPVIPINYIPVTIHARPFSGSASL